MLFFIRWLSFINQVKELQVISWGDFEWGRNLRKVRAFPPND